MSRCQICHKGLNSSYIRVGVKQSFKKVGLYCIACDIYYSPQPMESQNNINIDLKSSNNHNDSAKNIQNLYGPGRDLYC